MLLLDVDAEREGFMEAVYNILSGDPDNVRANMIIDCYDNLPTVDAVVLPCKVGDTLFFVRNGEIYSGAVRFLWWEHHKDRGVRSEIRINPDPYFSVGASLDDFGKTVFLTREEAETALAKMDLKEEHHGE